MSKIQIGCFNILPKSSNAYPTNMTASLTHDGFGLDTGNDSIFMGYADDCIETSVDYDEQITANDSIKVKLDNGRDVSYYGARVITEDGTFHKDYLSVTLQGFTITLKPTNTLVNLPYDDQKKIVAIIINYIFTSSALAPHDKPIEMTTTNCYPSIVLPACYTGDTPDMYFFPIGDSEYHSITATSNGKTLTPEQVDGNIYKVPSLYGYSTNPVTYNAEYTNGEAPVITQYTVTYEDGVNGTAFESQSYTVNSGDNTPAFSGTPTREGYNFTGWNPAVAETVTEDATYTAQWEEVQPTPTKKTRLFPLTNTYKLTYEQLQKISEGTWFRDAQQGTTVSPADYTTSLKKVFCDVPTTETDIFRFATWTDKDITCDIVTDNIVKLNCGSKEISEKYNSVADYNNTVIEIYLPFDGIEQLDTEKVMNKTITVKYNVDCITGDSIITITDNDDTLLYTYSCNISQDFPYLNEMLNGGNFNFQSGVPVSLDLVPYIIVRRTKSSELDNNNTNNKRDLIGNFTGYNQFTDFNVSTKATLKEQAEIIQLLQGGIIL